MDANAIKYLIYLWSNDRSAWSFKWWWTVLFC